MLLRNDSVTSLPIHHPRCQRKSSKLSENSASAIRQQDLHLRHLCEYGPGRRRCRRRTEQVKCRVPPLYRDGVQQRSSGWTTNVPER